MANYSLIAEKNYKGEIKTFHYKEGVSKKELDAFYESLKAAPKKEAKK